MTKAQAIRELKAMGCKILSTEGKYLVRLSIPNVINCQNILCDPKDMLIELQDRDRKAKELAQRSIEHLKCGGPCF